MNDYSQIIKQNLHLGSEVIQKSALDDSVTSGIVAIGKVVVWTYKNALAPAASWSYKNAITPAGNWIYKNTLSVPITESKL